MVLLSHKPLDPMLGVVSHDVEACRKFLTGRFDGETVGEEAQRIVLLKVCFRVRHAVAYRVHELDIKQGVHKSVGAGKTMGRAVRTFGSTPKNKYPIVSRFKMFLYSKRKKSCRTGSAKENRRSFRSTSLCFQKCFLLYSLYCHKKNSVVDRRPIGGLRERIVVSKVITRRLFSTTWT
jgi:hypothetical protein